MSNYRNFVSIGTLLRIACLLILTGVLSLVDVAGQRGTLPNPAGPTLKEFFDSLVKHYSPSSLPTFQQLTAVEDRIPSARPDDIVQALPPIFAALAHPDINVKINAASALAAITFRQDSSSLLRGYISRIGELSNASDPRLQTSMVLFLGGLKPASPPDVIPILAAFVMRTDRDRRSQASAASILLRLAPDNPEVSVAIRSFVSRPMDGATKIDVLNSLGDSNTEVKNKDVIETVILSLRDKDSGVRFTAVQVVARLGQPALRQAEPELKRMARNPDEAANVKAYAEEALRRIQRPAR